jgi:hypothetical protein
MPSLGMYNPVPVAYWSHAPTLLTYDHFGPQEEGQVRLEQPCFSSLLFGCFRHPWHLLYFVVRYCTDSALIIIQEDVWQLPQRVAP